MFSKAKAKDKDATGAAPGEAAEAAMAAPTNGRRAGSGQSGKGSSALKSTVPSIISQDVVTTGASRAAGEVQLDGTLEGDVEAAALIVGEKAVVKGEIVCEKITVRGKVEGGIRARSVTLANTAYIDGDILHSALSVETGAFFEGNCRHYDDPLSEAAAKEFMKHKKGPVSATLNGSAEGKSSEPQKAAASQSNDKSSGAFQQKAQLR